MKDAAYLGRYAGQPWESALSLPHTLRHRLVAAVTRIVKAEKGDE